MYDEGRIWLGWVWCILYPRVVAVSVFLVRVSVGSRV